jgi:hypothetical protein
VGTVKDKTATHIGSPIQLDFLDTSSDAHVPKDITPWQADVPTCWDSALRCSCGDCPIAPACGLPSAQHGDWADTPCVIHLFAGISPRCLDIAVWVPGLLLLGVLGWLFTTGALVSGPAINASVHRVCFLCALRRETVWRHSSVSSCFTAAGLTRSLKGCMHCLVDRSNDACHSAAAGAVTMNALYMQFKQTAWD